MSQYERGDGDRAYDLRERINIGDKRLLNYRTVDVNQLRPLKYDWAWEHYTNG